MHHCEIRWGDAIVHGAGDTRQEAYRNALDLCKRVVAVGTPHPSRPITRPSNVIQITAATRGGRTAR
jgi:hypothetical protein